MKKILIFTASTGNGHNQVAKTLEFELNEQGYDVVKVDFMKEKNKMLEMFIEDGYDILATKLPRVYGQLYRVTNRSSISKALSKIVSLEEYRLGKSIVQKHNPDMIIGTHPFAVGIVSALKRKGRIQCPFISVVTDFEAHQTYISDYVDAYITGSHQTSKSLISKGIEPDKVNAYGIPISKKFFSQSPEPIERDPLFTILLMGGSMGLKPMKVALEELMNAAKPFKITIVCGNNISLLEELEGKYENYEGNKKIEILGFTENVSCLMSQSDIIISKPGGLTVSESIAKRLPLVIPFVIPGQEEENRDFLALTNAAIKVEDISGLPEIIDYLIDNPERIEGMRKAMESISEFYSLESFIGLIRGFFDNE